MTTKRPPSQLELDLPMPGRGEPPRPIAREAEVVTAMSEPENPASTAYLMEAICDPENIEAALRAVVRNKGAPGVDGITVRQTPGHPESALAGDRRTTAPGALPAATGASGANPETGRRDTRPRHSNRDRPRYSRCGTRRSASTATASGRGAPPSKRWRRRKPMSSKAISSWLILTWPSFLTE